MKRIFSLISLCLALVSTQARADIALEPYVGYLIGKSATDTASNTMSGAEYGLRLGYYKLGFMLGAEYMAGSMTEKNSSASISLTKSDIGVTAGFTFPILLRVFGTYFLMASDKYTNTEFTGSGFKLGIGYTLLPLVSLNLEYYSNTYNKNKTTGNNLTTNFTDTLYGLSISVPLNF